MTFLTSNTEKNSPAASNRLRYHEQFSIQDAWRHSMCTSTCHNRHFVHKAWMVSPSRGVCSQYLRADNAMLWKHPVFLLTLASTVSFSAASRGRCLHSLVYNDFASMTQWLYEPVRPVSSGRRHRFIAQQWQPQTKALKTCPKEKKNPLKEGVRTILHFREILINFISR